MVFIPTDKTLNLMYAGALRKKKIQDDNIENDNSAMDIDNTDDNMDGGSAEVESVSDQEPANETVQEEVRITNFS